jgi:lipopolysaccharide export system permease protein
MRILDNYISRNVTTVFFSTILVFCFLYVLIDSATNLDEFINSKVTFDIIIQYYLSYLPVIISQTAPFAFLIATLLTFTHLNSHNEIIVLRTSGLDFWKIVKPALCLAFLVSALIFLVNERLVPQAEADLKKIKNENLILEVDKKDKKKSLVKNLTFYGLKNRLYFIDTFDPNTYEMEGVTIIEFDNKQNIKEKVVALSGKWTGIAWKFFKCHVTTFSTVEDFPTKVKIYEEKLLDIEEKPEDFLKQRLNVSSMNIKQLDDYIMRFSNSGAKRAINNLRVDLHWKIAAPFNNIVIVLVGLPLVLTTGRRKALTFTSLGIAIGVGFLFYVCQSVGLALGKAGLFPPILAAWCTPLLFTSLAFYLIRTNFE